jgi:cell division protein FtsB
LGLILYQGKGDFFPILKKKELLLNLKKEEISLTKKIVDLDHKNSLLSSNLDLDYVETLIRERFLFGKEGETIYIIKKNEN